MFSRSIATVLALSSGAAVALPVAGQHVHDEWRQECQERASRAQQVAVCEVAAHRLELPAGPLRIDGGGSGHVNVRAGEVDEVRVTTRLQVWAATADRARQIADAVTVHLDDGDIGAHGLATRIGESWTVHFDVTVPARSDLHVRSANGSVAVSGVSGLIDAATANGSLVLAGVQGDVRGTSVNGSIRIGLEGPRWEGPGLYVTTTNGGVALTVPEDYSADLDVAVTNDRVATTIAVPAGHPGRRETTYRATLGEGGAPLRVVTRNGLVTVNGQHGRPLQN